jgi:hypothetical protein
LLSFKKRILTQIQVILILGLGLAASQCKEKSKVKTKDSKENAADLGQGPNDWSNTAAQEALSICLRLYPPEADCPCMLSAIQKEHPYGEFQKAHESLLANAAKTCELQGTVGPQGQPGKQASSSLLWQDSQKLSSNSYTRIQDQPVVIGVGAGRVLAVYPQAPIKDSSGQYLLTSRLSLDGGRSWLEPKAITTSDYIINGIQILASSKGDVFVAWHSQHTADRSRIYSSQIKITNGSEDWTKPTPISIENLYPRFDTAYDEGQMRFWISWIEKLGVTTRVMLRSFDIKTGQWASPSSINVPQTYSTFYSPALDFNRNGEGLLSWIGFKTDITASFFTAIKDGKPRAAELIGEYEKKSGFIQPIIDYTANVLLDNGQQVMAWIEYGHEGDRKNLYMAVKSPGEDLKITQLSDDKDIHDPQMAKNQDDLVLMSWVEKDKSEDARDNIYYSYLKGGTAKPSSAQLVDPINLSTSLRPRLTASQLEPWGFLMSYIQYEPPSFALKTSAFSLTALTWEKSQPVGDSKLGNVLFHGIALADPSHPVVIWSQEQGEEEADLELLSAYGKLEPLEGSQADGP